MACRLGQDHSRVRCHRTITTHDDRIQVQLRDVRTEGAQQSLWTCHLHEQIDQELPIDCLASSGAVENPDAPQLVEHRSRVMPADRAKAERYVLQNFNIDAAKPDHDHGPEPIIAHCAHDHFDAGFAHLLDQVAVDARLANHWLGTDGVDRRANASGAIDAQHDCTGVTLVHDVG